MKIKLVPVKDVKIIVILAKAHPIIAAHAWLKIEYLQIVYAK